MKGSDFQVSFRFWRTSKQDQKWAFDEFLFCKTMAVEEEREEATELVELGQVAT